MKIIIFLRMIEKKFSRPVEVKMMFVSQAWQEISILTHVGLSVCLCGSVLGPGSQGSNMKDPKK